jgi:peptidoglycan/LPS O-acetylase OafA/YrhL
VRQRYLALDGLRGIAAIAVMLFHLRLSDSDHLLFSHAYLAVDLFLVLSGFVLARAYDDRLAGGLGLPRFLAIRLFRLYPTYLIGVALGCIVRWNFQPDLSSSALLMAAVSAVLFIPVPIPALEAELLFPLDPPTWSLLFELIVNGFLALAFARLSPRNLLILVAVSALGVCFVAGQHGNLHVGWEAGTLASAFPRAFFSFFAGVLLARMPRLPIPALVPELLFLGCVVVLIAPAPAALRGVWDPVIVLLLFPTAVAALSRIEVSATLAPAAQALGALSYPLYVIHFPIFELVAVINAGWFGFPLAGVAVATVAFIFLVSYWLGAYFDAPIVRYLRAPAKTTAED